MSGLLRFLDGLLAIILWMSLLAGLLALLRLPFEPASHFSA